MNHSHNIFAEMDRLRKPMTDFLQALVRIPSLPGKEQVAQRFFAGRLQAIRCEVEILTSQFAKLEHHLAFSDDGVSFAERLNVVGQWKGTEETGRLLILNGHMDVVPVGNSELRSFAPWNGTVENGKLHGRGACDTKAGLAAAVLAIEALGNFHFKPHGTVLLQNVIGEESGGIGALTTLVRGIRADAAILMEPTRFHSYPVHAGALSFRIKITGRAIHVSMKRFGVSAVESFSRYSLPYKSLTILATFITKTIF